MFIIQPELLPLPERIALGGWERHEELCIQFVAYTRARERLIFLTQLETVNRQNILGLWDEPVSRSDPPSAAHECAEPVEEADPVAEQEAIVASLALLGLPDMPSTEAAINEAFKATMRKVHPDRHFGSRAANDHSHMLLEARAILKRALASA